MFLGEQGGTSERLESSKEVERSTKYIMVMKEKNVLVNYL